MRRIIIITFLFSIITTIGFTQSNHYQRIFYNAFVSGNMEQWRQDMTVLQRQAASNDMDLQYELLIAEYGYIAWSIGTKHKQETRLFLPGALDRLERLYENNPGNSEILALKGAFLGFEMSGALYKAPFLGPRSANYIRAAVKQDSLSPYGWIQAGNAKYYMPSAFGGSKETAIQYYETAAKNFRLMRQNNPYNWRYLNLLIQMAKVYEELGELKKARNIFEEILFEAPVFPWVHDTLYPEFLSRNKLLLKN